MNDPQPYLPGDEVNDIMTFVPGWIVHWGSTVIVLTVLMLGAVSWLIRYPDVMHARITIVAANPPIPVIARASGRVHLLVADQTVVTAGTFLAVLETPARLEDVLALRRNLQAFLPFLADPTKAPLVPFDRAAALGELQSAYNDFIQNLDTYETLRAHLTSGSNLVGTIQYGDHLSKLVHQQVVTTKALELIEMKYRSSRVLFEKGVLSEVEMAEIERQRHETRATLEYVNGDIEYVTRNLIITVQLACKRLESQVREWEQQYVLVAPMPGTVALFDFWSDNQFVNANSEVLTIVPPVAGITGKVYLPLAGAGKVQAGQRVVIRCDNYPFREYGFLRGVVQSMSLMPKDQQYLVQVSLPDGLRTTYHKSLVFQQEMHGSAGIITQNARLIERIFARLRAAFESTQ
jgi:multidrug resistance efflux pump